MRAKTEATDKATEEERQFYQYKVLAPGVKLEEATYGPKSSLGWDGVAISRSNKDPVRTMKLDFLASEEGQYLLMWGVEGEHWDMKDGKHVPRQEVLDAFKKNWDEASRTTVSASGPG